MAIQNQKLLPFIKSKDFVADYASASGNGLHSSALKEMWALLEILRLKKPIPAQYLDHALKGEWKGWRDCHTAGDFVLIWNYQPINGVEHVVLAGCGTHAHLGL